MSREMIKYLLGATLILAIIFPFLDLPIIYILLLAIIAYIVLFMIFSPKIGLFLLLFIRPCLDILTDQEIIRIGSITINFAAILGILSIIFALYIGLKHYSDRQKIPLKIPIGIFLSITILSVLWSISPNASLTEWARLLSIFSIYTLAFLLIKTKEDFVTMIRVVIFSALIPAALAFYQFAFNQGMSLPFEGIYNRIYGTFAHPNLFAYYLILPIVLSIFLLVKCDRKKVGNLVSLIPLPFYLILLVLTYTRGAWLAFVVIMLFVSVWKFKKFLAIFIIAMFAIYLTIATVNTRVNNLVANPYSSIYWRVNLWRDSITYSQNKIFTGYGAGTAKEVILDKRGAKFGSTDPHNDYLKISLENGLLGLLSYFALIGTLFYELIRKYKKEKLPALKMVLLFLIAFTISLYGMSFADNVLRNTALMWVYWSVLGGIFAVSSPILKSSDSRSLSINKYHQKSSIS